jgi:hypothetical protein
MELTNHLQEPPKKSPLYPLDRRLSGSQAGLDAVARRKILLLPLPGIELRSSNPSLYCKYPEFIPYCNLLRTRILFAIFFPLLNAAKLLDACGLTSVDENTLVALLSGCPQRS